MRRNKKLRAGNGTTADVSRPRLTMARRLECLYRRTLSRLEYGPRKGMMDRRFLHVDDPAVGRETKSATQLAKSTSAAIDVAKAFRVWRTGRERTKLEKDGARQRCSAIRA